jgi:hypothetical protein
VKKNLSGRACRYAWVFHLSVNVFGSDIVRSDAALVPAAPFQKQNDRHGRILTLTVRRQAGIVLPYFFAMETKHVRRRVQPGGDTETRGRAGEAGVRRGGERVDQPTRWIHGIRFDSNGKSTRRAHPLASPSGRE